VEPLLCTFNTLKIKVKALKHYFLSAGGDTVTISLKKGQSSGKKNIKFCGKKKQRNNFFGK
jgi:hypothetical protein